MVDEEAVEMTMIPFNPPSRQGAETETSGRRTRVCDGGGIRVCSMEKCLSLCVFRSGGTYSREGSRGSGRGDLLTSWRGQVGPAPLGDEGPSGLSSVWSSWFLVLLG